MTISVSYASLRSEVWQWYWQAWRKKLWMYHAVVFVFGFIGLSEVKFGGLSHGLVEWPLVAALSLIPLMFLIMYPQLQFKPQLRVLTLTEQGVFTSIGKYQRDYLWKEFSEVEEKGADLVMQLRNLNAFIVPMRAFSSDSERTRFFEFAVSRVEHSST